MKRIKLGDEVIITVGKDKGHKGKIIKVTDDGVLVEGGNLVKKHVKSNPQKPELAGGIIAREAFLHLSKVALYNPSTQRADKVGFKFIADGDTEKKVRYFKSNNEIIDAI